MSLRQYQQDGVKLMRTSISNGHKRIFYCAPTGSGKTRTFCFLVSQHLKKGGKVLIITDRIELLKQAGKDFENIEEIKAGHEPDLSKSLHVSMIETLHVRMDKEYYQKFLSTRTMTIIDEGHKCAFDKIFPFFSETAFVFGFSATPKRDGKQPSLDTFYTDMVQTIDVPELIEQGFLAKAITYGVDIDMKGIKKKGSDYDQDSVAQMFSEKKLYEGVIENYNTICPNTKAILYASNVNSSKEIVEKFNLAGIPARHLDGKTPKKERTETFLWFKECKVGVLSNCGVATTGYDEPTIQSVILYMCTLSLIKFLQCAGRGGRIIPNVKDSFFLLDFGNNVKTHNFWESPRSWSLEKKKKKDKVGPAPVKICPGCRAMLPVSANECSFCQYKFKKEYGGKNEFAELKLLSPPEIWKTALGADIATKARMAKEKVIKPMAVLHTLETKEEGLEFIRQMGYKPTFAYLNRHRFKCFESM